LSGVSKLQNHAHTTSSVLDVGQTWPDLSTSRFIATAPLVAHTAQQRWSGSTRSIRLTFANADTATVVVMRSKLSPVHIPEDVSLWDFMKEKLQQHSERNRVAFVSISGITLR